MQKSDPELRRILVWTVDSFYPELHQILRDGRIKIVYANLKTEYANFNYNGGNIYKINFDRKTMESAPKDAKIGAGAHELEHIVTEEGLDDIQTKIDMRLRRYEPYRVLDERDNDVRVVLRGLGKYLHEFERFAVEKNIFRSVDAGLTIDEIEKLLKIR